MAPMFRINPSPKLRAVPALAAVVVFGIAFAAGHWQTGRAAEKDVTEARHAAAFDAPAVALPADAATADPVSLDGRRVALRGVFLYDKTIYLDNQVQNRVAGYHVLTPFKTDAGVAMLVNRGWVRLGASRDRLPSIPAVTGDIGIEGRIALPPKHIYEIKPEVHMAGPPYPASKPTSDLDGLPNASRVWQNLLIPAMARQSGINLPPYVLRQSTDTGDGLTRAWDAPAAQPGMTAAKHRGYAFQWYALAALTAFLFLFFTLIEYGEPSRNA